MASEQYGPVERREQIKALFKEGEQLDGISKKLKVHPSYVAQVLRQSGLIDKADDLFANSDDNSIYSRFFRHVLNFSNVEAAEKSIERIDSLYKYFEEIGDRAGQHQAMVIALTGKNRARWSGKQDVAKIFSDWLVAH